MALSSCASISSLSNSRNCSHSIFSLLVFSIAPPTPSLALSCRACCSSMLSCTLAYTLSNRSNSVAFTKNAYLSSSFPVRNFFASS